MAYVARERAPSRHAATARGACAVVAAGVLGALLAVRITQAQGPFPGGVFSNIQMWMKADAGVTVVFGAVSNWTDASPAFRAAAQGTLSERPAYLTNGINFNPSLNFDGSSDFLVIPNSQLSGIPTGDSSRALIIVGTNNILQFRHAVSWGNCRPPEVRVFHMVGGSPVVVANFFAYDPAFVGGVHVAVADVDGDGVADIITAPGQGGGPHVRVFSLAGGTPVEIAGFFAYDPSFTGGVFVAGGDVDGDGRAEIITGASRQGGPLRVFKRDALGAISELTSFYPYFPAFLGPVRVGAADVNGDGLADVITAAGPGGGPHVQVFSLAGSVPIALASFYAYAPAWCDVGGPVDPVVCDGVYVAGGDVTGDGIAEIITGTNRAGGPVRIFQILGGGGAVELTSFFPYFEAFPGPVRVSSASTPHVWPAALAPRPELPADDERAYAFVSARNALLTSPADAAAAGT